MYAVWGRGDCSEGDVFHICCRPFGEVWRRKWGVWRVELGLRGGGGIVARGELGELNW